MRILRVLIIGGDSVIGRAISNFWDGDLSVDCYSSTRSREEISRKRPYINLKKIVRIK